MSRRSRKTGRLLLGAIALATFAGGCEALTEPNPIEGVFVLRSIGPNPVPAATGTVLSTEFWALAATITLRADGSGEWTSTSSRRDLLTETRDTNEVVLRFEHSRRSTTIRATGITCEPMCESLPGHAEFSIDGNWLTWGVGPTAQRFERVAPSIALYRRLRLMPAGTDAVTDDR